MCEGKVTRREKCRWCDADEANADAEALAVADEGPEWRKSGSGRWGRGMWVVNKRGGGEASYFWSDGEQAQ